MTHYNRSIITIFLSNNNISYLKSKILQKYNYDICIKKYITDDQFKSHLLNASHMIGKEISTSDPIQNLSKEDHIMYFNNKFLSHEFKFIDSYIFRTQPNEYKLTENPKGNFKDTHPEYADKLLCKWQMNPGRLSQIREDNMAKPTAGTYSITYCDITNLNTQNHYDMYESTSYKLALNDGNHDPFGVANPKTDERLLSRRIYRNGKYGENTIPHYEHALYVRNYERDISENLQAYEKDFINRKHDMSDLIAMKKKCM